MTELSKLLKPKMAAAEDANALRRSMPESARIPVIAYARVSRVWQVVWRELHLTRRAG